MQIHPGTQKIQNRGREANHGPIHGSPQNVENLQTGYRRLTNMANRGPGERGFQERLFIPFNQRRVPTPRQRSMGIQNFPFFFGNTRSPVITGTERNGWTVTLNWENGIDCPKASASDQVFVGYFYDTLRRSPCLLRDIPARRGDENVTIEIPSGDQPEGTPLHLYLFFGDSELARFSPSEYTQV